MAIASNLEQISEKSGNAMLSLVCRGTLERAIPYANLTNMDFLEMDGFVAGVTNPLFEQRENVKSVLFFGGFLDCSCSKPQPATVCLRLRHSGGMCCAT